MDVIANIYNKHKDKPYFLAGLAAIIYGCIVHSFAFFNILQNHDSIAIQPGGFGMGISLGRWFLEILGFIFDKIGLSYNLPVVNGVVYVCLLAISAAFLVDTLQIKNKLSAVLIGALLVSFPSTTATMIYRFTVVYYGIGVLFAILAVWVLIKNKRAYVISIILISLSMGIYQAYAPITIALFVLDLIRRGLHGEDKAKTLILRGISYCLVLICGLIVYYIGVAVSLKAVSETLVSYQGVSSMGTISIDQLPTLILQAIRTVCMLPVQDFCGIANRMLMRVAYLFIFISCAAMTVYIFVKKKMDPVTIAVVCLLCTAFILAVGFIIIMVPNGWIYTLMVYSFCTLACAPLVVLECMPESASQMIMSIAKKIAACLVALLVIYYGYYANVNYTTVYYAGEQINNYLSGVITRATMTEGYTPDKQWAMIGDINDPLLSSPWEQEISYTGLGYTQYLINQYSRNMWIQNYIGYNLPYADEDTVTQLASSEEVKTMPCYPSAGSIQIIGDVVVVKFQNDVY